MITSRLFLSKAIEGQSSVFSPKILHIRMGSGALYRYRQHEGCHKSVEWNGGMEYWNDL